MRWMRWVGLAGLAGVAATGAVVARAERRRRAYTPDEIRSRLHERVAAADAAAGDPTDVPADVAGPGSPRSAAGDHGRRV